MANIFSVLIGVLHESRRRHAVQIIRSYPHLMHEDAGRKISANIAELRIASRAYARPTRDAFASWKGICVTFFITPVILEFGILHMIGGTLTDHAKAAHASQSTAVAD